MASSIYICYFGLDQPLVQTQVVPYLAELAKGGHDIRLLTFEPDPSAWTEHRIEATRARLAAKGIEWSFLAYHKRPSALATAWDIFTGVRWLRREMTHRRADILHGRGHVAALMGAIARNGRSAPAKLLFDIRGFMPEEYTDAGVWPENGLIYRAAKRAEAWLYRVSDGFVILTEKARDLALGGETRPVEVIPCCVDFTDRFPEDLGSLRKQMRDRLGIGDRRVLTHIGALGGLYLTEELADLMAVARERDGSIFPMFLTQTSQAGITAALKARGFAEGSFYVGQAAPAEIPGYLAASDAGLSLVKATYSTQSRSPTKIPEYLAAGLPVIANAGVGDVDRLILDDGVGVLVEGFDRDSYSNALYKLEQLGDISDKCRETARLRFDLETVGGVRYRRIYENLLQS